jgi:hypothetical protein
LKNFGVQPQPRGKDEEANIEGRDQDNAVRSGCSKRKSTGQGVYAIGREENEMIDFTAIEDFYSEELESYYVKGLSYTARPGDEKLKTLLPFWLNEKKIVYGRPSATLRGE